jgi:alkanesulfonate monooxygenase SsuD/methylene tetrahydromethanopterin reductase-like flavin-dependent oxidoreductase (luciferase family)
VIVGGRASGARRNAAARFADEYNVPFGSPTEVRERYAAVADACARFGRDGAGRAPLVRSVALTVCCGRTDAEVHQRAAAAGTSVERAPPDLSARRARSSRDRGEG